MRAAGFTHFCTLLTFSISVNPFAKRDSHSASSIITYKVLTLVTWLLSVISTVYYNFEAPHDGRYHGGNIWHQNYHYYSGFTLNSVIASIYWLVPPASYPARPMSKRLTLSPRRRAGSSSSSSS